jgi:hypothetical protein
MSVCNDRKCLPVISVSPKDHAKDLKGSIAEWRDRRFVLLINKLYRNSYWSLIGGTVCTIVVATRVEQARAERSESLTLTESKGNSYDVR